MKTRYAIVCVFLCRFAFGETQADPPAQPQFAPAAPIIHQFSSKAQEGNEPQLGFCYDNLRHVDNAYGKYIKPDLDKAQWPAPIRIGAEAVSKKQWMAIDVMARTMMGEIGGCPENLAAARKVARIIVNRKEADQKAGKGIIGTEAFDPIANVCLKPAQFSVWNGSDPANHLSICPDPTSQRWKDYVTIATGAVIHPDRIKLATTDIDAANLDSGRPGSSIKTGHDVLDYTNGCQLYYSRPCAGYLPILDDNPDSNHPRWKTCFDMWDETYAANPKTKWIDAYMKQKADIADTLDVDSSCQLQTNDLNCCDDKGRIIQANAAKCDARRAQQINATVDIAKKKK